MSKFELANDGEINATGRKYKLEQMKDTSHVRITTNFEISRRELDTISKVEGVDSFEQSSRYVVKVIIGDLFEPVKVINDLEFTMAKVINAKPGNVKDIEQALENMKKVRDSQNNNTRSVPGLPWNPFDSLPRRYG